MFTPTVQTIRAPHGAIPAAPDRREAPMLQLSPTVRVLLMLIAFAGSAVYAASYRLVTSTADLTPIATAIGIAAAIAWIGFGFLLLTVAQMHPRRFARATIWHWADVCLVAMSLGMAIKMIGVGANVILAATHGDRVDLSLIAPMQLALLIVTDGVMGFIFTRLTARIGMPTRMACLLWIVALNGIFAAVLGSLIAYGGFMP